MLTYNFFSLITIMLARLRMPVEDCMEEYRKLGGVIFGKPRHIHHAGIMGILPIKRNKFSSESLESTIKDVIRRRGEISSDHDDAMLFNTPKGLCRA